MSLKAIESCWISCAPVTGRSGADRLASSFWSARARRESGRVVSPAIRTTTSTLAAETPIRMALRLITKPAIAGGVVRSMIRTVPSFKRTRKRIGLAEYWRPRPRSVSRASGGKSTWNGRPCRAAR
jgi:hypothetical protein